jgi:hypothetical protein
LPWIKFCLQAHAFQAQKLLRRVEEVDALWSRLEKCVAENKLPERSIHALSRAASGASIRSMTYRIDTEVSSQVAKKDLKLLVDKGLLVPAGEKRGRTYRASQVLKRMYHETRIKRQIPDPFALTDRPLTADDSRAAQYFGDP